MDYSWLIIVALMHHFSICARLELASRILWQYNCKNIIYYLHNGDCFNGVNGLTNFRVTNNFSLKCCTLFWKTSQNANLIFIIVYIKSCVRARVGPSRTTPRRAFYSRWSCKYTRETLAGAVNINLHQGPTWFLQGCAILPAKRRYAGFIDEVKLADLRYQTRKSWMPATCDR